MLKQLTIMDLLKCPLTELISRANAVRKSCAGPGLELCSILNAKSGLCKEDCKFCAQSSRHSAGISAYPLKSKDEIVKAARRAKANGAHKFGIVTSGNRLSIKEIDVIAKATSEIKDGIGIAVCASLGALTKQELKTLKEAGLSRYHHNIETSPGFYANIVSTHGFKERIETITAAKEVGLEVCSGGIIGMGETWQDRMEMADVLKKLDVDSIPINILVPIKGTPFEHVKPLSCNEVIRTIAIFRIVLGDKIIKIAAGRDTILSDFQALGFLAGANGMIIGGYLTIKGRDIEKDRRLVKEVEKLWAE